MFANFSRWRPWLALMRFDRPVGSLLLLWPTLAALWLAAEGVPPVDLIAVFTLGVFIMRAAGCVINDLADRRLDPLVARTRSRPLATGAISVRGALGLFVGLCLAALALLAWLNAITRWLAVAGLAVAMLYPFMKRWTHLPQVVLGVAFSWGIVMAFAAVSGGVPATGWLFFVASLLWIVAYDTLYAMVDRDDDLKAGIKSTAILFGAADRWMVGALQAGAWLGFALLGLRCGFGTAYSFGLAAIIALFAYQHVLIREPSACPRTARRRRRRNNPPAAGLSPFVPWKPSACPRTARRRRRRNNQPAAGLSPFVPWKPLACPRTARRRGRRNNPPAAGLSPFVPWKRDRDRCFKAFLNNIWVGFVLFAAVVVELSVLPR